MLQRPAQRAGHTYDSNYAGNGNWPFNTAYAGRFGLHGFVTRLCSLNEIHGHTYGTNGHLLVPVGFSATGQPVLEAAWLNTSGGIVDVIHPASMALPAAQPNW